MRHEKPWDKLGISRATWYRQGKPTHIAQEEAAQLVYTSVRGIRPVRRVMRQADKNSEFAQFRVARRKSNSAIDFDDFD